MQICIGDTGAIIPDKADAYKCKVVSYNQDSEGNLSVNAVYSLENYDYNIHDGDDNIAKVIIEMENDYGCG